MTTPEQQAREMLERMGIGNAYERMSAGELVELANLIAENTALKAELEAMRARRSSPGRDEGESMTTITREHLTLAAKAAGKKIEFLDDSDFIFSAFIDGVYWSPHTDPADTWQLAADCRLNIDFDNERVFYQDEDDMYAGIWFCKAWHCTAMEAVTLAAAEIGRAMG